MKQEMDYIVKYLEKFDQVPFCVAMDQKEYRIGAGDPKFRVVLRNPIPKTALLTSTSLALGCLLYTSQDGGLSNRTAGRKHRRGMQ